MKKILICGATSFVAKEFKELLIQQGFDVDTFGRKDGSYLEIDKNPILADSYEAVVNFAVLKDQSIEDNVSYMKSLVEMCKQKQVKKLIHFSSIMVYSYHLGKLDENSPIDTVANTMMEGYGKIKIACDEFLNSVKQSLPFEVVMVRPGYVLADNRPAPFIKRLPCGVSVILGNKKSRQPIVKREDIHLALLKIIETDKNLPVYHLFQNNDITKYNFAKQTVGGLILVLPKFIFEGLPRLMMKTGLMKKALYSRFDGMYNYNVASSTMTESKLNIKFK
ncbi:MAG: NAD(P)-dependent oxidoreductase [Bacteroidota bacterium]|nr:NAD(P)-dependent oxidoreductase [Bacteroidota bacterium]